MTLSRRLASETLGTLLLVAAIVGSGIMGDRLSPGNAALTLLANSLATGAALVVLGLVFGPVSGAHFNPLVSIALAARRELPWREVPSYLAAQVVGALLGVVLAHGMFDLPLVSAFPRPRSGAAQLLSELVATFGLLATVRGTRAPYAVGLYIAAAYWFTASTSFANPAVTLARSLTSTFSGIRAVDVPGFILAQAVGALAAVAFFAWLRPEEPA